MTYVDDIPGEILIHALNKIIGKDCKNFHIIPSITKKGRPGYIVLIDVDKNKIDDVVKTLIFEYGILGFRIISEEHKPISYIEKQIKVTFKGEKYIVRLKAIVSEKEVISVKAEYEDLSKIQNKLLEKGIRTSLKKIKSIIEATFYKEEDEVDLDKYIKGKEEK